jgi:hypothetical protein
LLATFSPLVLLLKSVAQVFMDRSDEVLDLAYKSSRSKVVELEWEGTRLSWLEKRVRCLSEVFIIVKVLF